MVNNIAYAFLFDFSLQKVVATVGYLHCFKDCKEKYFHSKKKDPKGV